MRRTPLVSLVGLLAVLLAYFSPARTWEKQDESQIDSLAQCHRWNDAGCGGAFAQAGIAPSGGLIREPGTPTGTAYVVWIRGNGLAQWTRAATTPDYRQAVSYAQGYQQQGYLTFIAPLTNGGGRRDEVDNFEGYHTNPTRKRGPRQELTSLTRRVNRGPDPGYS